MPHHTRSRGGHDGSWRPSISWWIRGGSDGIFHRSRGPFWIAPIIGRSTQAAWGGLAPSVWVQTSLRLQRDDGGTVTFKSHFVGFTALAALDMSLLGRDVLNFFAVIVDQPHNVVCLLTERHQYVIQTV